MEVDDVRVDFSAKSVCSPAELNEAGNETGDTGLRATRACNAEAVIQDPVSAQRLDSIARPDGQDVYFVAKRRQSKSLLGDL